MKKGYLLWGIGNKIMNSYVISRKGYDSDVSIHIHYITFMFSYHTKRITISTIGRKYQFFGNS